MQIRVVKNVSRFFHRSWMQWWEVIYYYRVFTAGTESDFDIVKQLHDYLYVSPAEHQNLLNLVPFEAVLHRGTSFVVGAHCSFSADLDPVVWQGLRFVPLDPWSPINVQSRMLWHSSLTRERWYSDYPYPYRFDFSNRRMTINLRNILDTYGQSIVQPLPISPQSQARFARHDRRLGYIPVEDYQVYRFAVSNKTRIWGY